MIFTEINEQCIIGWFRMPLLPSDDPLVKMYVCHMRYHDSGFWKRLWLRLKIWHYKRLMKNG